MIALVSFPRSGNTFFRNLLFELYELPSSVYHLDPDRKLKEDWASFPVIKTHLLPDDLPAEMEGCSVVYLVRDGRDALVSIAHHRKDLVEPGTDFYNNLLEATLSLGNSNFGGWSGNVRAWSSKATVIVKYEDLIVDPVMQTERLRSFVELPEPQREKVPTFEDLKFGRPQYGSESSLSTQSDFAQKFFRKGKSGSWQEEMPADIQRLFWDLHGAQMRELGYLEGELPPAEQRPLKKVLIEVSKVYTPDNDGVKRYLLDLLYHLTSLQAVQPDWQIDLFFHGEIQPLQAFKREDTFPVFAETVAKMEDLQGYEKVLLSIKRTIKKSLPTFVYQHLSEFYRQGPFRRLLSWLRKQRINKQLAADTDFSKIIATYDLFHIPLPQHVGTVAQVSIPTVVTVHDLTHRLFPQYHTRENVRLAEEGMKLSVQQEAHYIAISEATEKDLLAHYPTSTGRTSMIYEGVSGRFNKRHKNTDFTAIREKYGLPVTGDYLLSLSTVEPRKNIKHLMEAFCKLKKKYPDDKTQLFICGKKGWLTDDLVTTEQDYQASGIYFTGFVDDHDLPLFYAHARGLCYVSHYEGFGLPLLEAMQSGTPVIFGNNSSMPEVVGEGGIGVDATDLIQLIEAMHQLISDNDLHTKLAAAAWQQANTFSPLQSAFKTMQYYEQIITKRGG